MPTPIKYRITSTPEVPTSTTVKGTPLTSAEIDGNFKSMVDSLDAMADSLDAKVDSSDLAAPPGAALVGADDGASGSLWTTVAGCITYLRSQIAGILDGATFTGPISLPGNAVDNLHAVPLQQLNAVAAAIPAAVGNYAPAFYQWRDLAILQPAPDTWVTLYGGVFQAYRGGWSINGTGVTVQAAGYMKVSVVGVDMSAAPGDSVLMRVKHNGTYINPEATYRQGELSDGLFVIVPVAVGDTLNVAIKASVGSDVSSFGCASLTYEYFGPAS